ncbi:NADP-specific glutamate dehydrogenase [Umbelopsis sp. PMI_123]|nr:NADP-specific glutamate dehydrogenase [Umbelopsis sp. PMI_123]
MSHLPNEPEFQQAVSELVSCLENSKLFKSHPDLRRCLEVVQVPERVIQFRVVWENDKGELQLNRGYRVQFNSTLGPYKGGLRFHPSVNLSILKFLGFEQIFKNALTGLSMGGGKGGCDFDPKGKSDAEIRRFCEAFMRELSRHIGPNVDVPAGDIGVGGREVGYMFGAYKKYRNAWEGVLTGKGFDFGGSYIRPEATGYGLVYYVADMIKYATAGKESFEGKTVSVSGSGNVAQFAARKVIELGGKVVSFSDSQGTLLKESGFTNEDIDVIADIKLKRKALTDLLEQNAGLKAETKYLAGERPWKHIKVDVALPSATQNEVDKADAEALVAGGCRFIAEGSNMGCDLDAIAVFESSRLDTKLANGGCWYGPGKASNCGGVAVSGLEMAQNSQRIHWTPEEVDKKLGDIMKNCFENCVETAIEYADESVDYRTPKHTSGHLPSLVQGANIAGFVKVANAMHDLGDWW